MCGPTVIAHGSDDQKERYLARLLRADDVWCQLFSEPASGSDLAGAAHHRRPRRRRLGRQRPEGLDDARARRRLRHPAHPHRPRPAQARRADDVRRRHARARASPCGRCARWPAASGFNEVFFDDVRIPDSERLGEPGEGWRVALTTLMNERVAIGGAGSDLGVPVEALAAHARDRLPALPPDRQVRRPPGGGPGGRRAAGHPLHRLPALHRAQPGRAARARRPAPASSPAPPPRGSPPTPACGCSATTRSTPTTADGDDTWQRTQAYLPGLAIAGGTDQVLRNILGERVLGPAAGTARRQVGAVLRRRAMNFDLGTDQRDAAAGRAAVLHRLGLPGRRPGRAGGRRDRARAQGAGRDRLPGHHRRRGRRRRRRIAARPRRRRRAGRRGAGRAVAGDRRAGRRPAGRRTPSWPRRWPTGRPRSPSSTGRRPRSTPRAPRRSSRWRTARWSSAPAR